MFFESKEVIFGREARVISGLGDYNLKDTFECGQCFRYEEKKNENGLLEYITVVGNTVIDVAQRKAGELIFFGLTDEEYYSVARPYFDVETDYKKIRDDIVSHTDSSWLISAAEAAGGIAILRQDPWEALFSFIISQNNNIPRIRGIIKKLSCEYGENICLQKGIDKCPLSKIDTPPCHEMCKGCGVCYTFPKAEDVAKNPEKMQSAKVGFRYKYLLDAALRVSSGELNLDMIAAARSYTYTKERLMEIYGVGEKVASCVALFGFANLEAFPIDVWMKRAIDEYFDGRLDPKSLGRYAGVAQQYIFHYIRNLNS